MDHDKKDAVGDDDLHDSHGHYDHSFGHFTVLYQ